MSPPRKRSATRGKAEWRPRLNGLRSRSLDRAQQGLARDDLLGSTNPQRGGRLEARNARVWSSNGAIEQCAQAASDNIVVLIKKLADKVDDPFADAHLSL